MNCDKCLGWGHVCEDCAAVGRFRVYWPAWAYGMCRQGHYSMPCPNGCKEPRA